MTKSLVALAGAVFLLGCAPASAGQTTPLEMQIDRTQNPSPVCAFKTTNGPCVALGSIGPSNVWMPAATLFGPSANSPCNPGQIADDANYHYVCVATNTWKRVALSPYTPLTVSSLPGCGAGSEGLILAVSDASSPTYNGTLTGGGTVHIPAYCNGTAWTAH